MNRTEVLSEFFKSDITVTLPKQQLQRLHDLLRDAVQSQENSRQDSTQNIKDRVRDLLQNQEDRTLLTYLAWVLSQQD
jgi:hypothetical protein